MKLTPESASPLLREYGISTGVTGINTYLDTQNDIDATILARVDVKHRPPLMMKLSHDHDHPHELIEKRCRFAEHLRRNGVPTPERYSKGGEYCLSSSIDGEKVDVVLEDFAGEPLSVLDADTARDAGMLLARTHRLSFRDNCKLGVPSSFDALGKNPLSGLDKFVELSKKALESQIKSVAYPHRLCKKPEICGEILDICNRRFASARELWDRLPRGAVQGNLNLHNLTRREGILTLCDFGCSGDETLVGDMLLEGLRLVYFSPLADGLTDASRPGLFEAFVAGYRRICPLTHDERVVACELYPVYNALMLPRIASMNGRFPDSLEGVMASGDCEKADEVLAAIYALITEDSRKIFASELFGN